MYSHGWFTRTHRPSIVANSTVLGIGHPATADDSQASLRAELLGQLVAAQFEIEAALKEAGSNVGAAKEGVAQLQLLTALQRQIGSANPAALASMRSEIIATVSVSHAVALQKRSAAETDSKIANLSEVTKNTRQTIQNIAHELFEQKKLDPYLQFQSAEDEAEYRKREAERKAYIERENAKGTPQGTLNATNAMAEQLKDAGDHGAAASPDFDRMRNATKSAEQSLLAAMPNETAPPAKQAEKKEAVEELDDVFAAFRDAGVTTTKTSNLDPAHGLSQSKPVVQTKQV